MTRTDLAEEALSAGSTPTGLASRVLPRWFIAVMLIVVFARGFVWSVATPPWQVPDEPSHASYAEQLRWEHDIFTGGVVHSRAIGDSFESGEPGPVSPNAMDADSLREGRDHFEAIDADRGASSTGFVVSSGGYPPTTYLLGAVTYAATDFAGGSYLTATQMLRILGAGIATLAFGLQMLIVSRLLRDQFRTVAACIIMAVLPMVGFASSSLNPDVLMAVWFSAGILLALRVQDHGFTWRPFIALIVVTMVAFLTKQTAIIFIPLLLVVAAGAHRNGTRLSPSHRAALFVGGVVAAVLPSRIFAVLDEPVGTVSALVEDGGSALGSDQILEYATLFREAFMPQYTTSFWANFGWLDTRFTDPDIYAYLAVLSTVAAIGVATRLIRRRRIPPHWLIAAVPLAALLAATVWIEYALVQSEGSLFIQGRYFFPLLPVLVAAYISGVTLFERWPWFGRGVVVGTIGIVMLLEVESWVMLALPRYSL